MLTYMIDEGSLRWWSQGGSLTDSAFVDSVHTDSVHTDSVHTDSVNTDSVHTDSVHTDSVYADSAVFMLPEQVGEARGNSRDRMLVFSCTPRPIIIAVASA